MKTKLSYKGAVLTTLMVVLFTMVNCEGPMGPMGPPGPMGPKGPKGDDAPPAQTSAELLVVEDVDWTTDSADFMISVVMESGIITEDVAINGIVSVYFGYPGSEEWTPLPYTFVESNILETYWYYQGYVEINRYGDSIVPAIPDETLNYKVSAIAK